MGSHVGRLSWAVIDQSVFALSNFGVNVLLARWLPVGEYGSFGLAFVLLLMTVALYGALVLDPMAVFGSKQYVECFQAYLRRLLMGTLAVAVPGAAVLSALTAFVAYFLGGSGTVAALAGFWLLVPFYFVQILVRRAAYVEGSPRSAAIAAATYATILCGAVVVLRYADSLSVQTAQAAIAISCLGASATAFRRVAAVAAADEINPARIIGEHWHFGRKALGVAVLSYASMNIAYFLLPLLDSIEAVAGWRVLFNLVLPILHINAALAAVLTPALARNAHKARMAPLVLIALICLVAGAVLYAAFLIAAPHLLLHAVFAGKYDALAATVPLMALFPVFYCVASTFALVCNASERMDTLLAAQAVGSLVCIGVAYPMLVRFDIGGAIGLLLIGEALKIMVLVVLLRRAEPVALKFGRSIRLFLRLLRYLSTRRRAVSVIP